VSVRAVFYFSSGRVVSRGPGWDRCYEGPPIKKKPGVNKPPPGAAGGAPRGAGSVTSILQRSLARFVRNFSVRITAYWFFNGFLGFSHREPLNRGEGEGQGWRGLITFGPKSVASLWGRGGFINRRLPVSLLVPARAAQKQTKTAAPLRHLVDTFTTPSIGLL
jgi:hypothetical protein